jgi:paraquat-inducible protein A
MTPIRPDKLCACPDCDLLLDALDDKSRNQQRCPRCNALLLAEHRGPSNLALAAAVSGLILFVPAVTLPIMEVNMVGRYGSHSLLSGIERLLIEGETALSVLVLLCSIAAPFLQLFLTALICLCINRRRYPNHFPTLLKVSHWMQEWSMLEVFAMGALVAYIKMMDPGEVNLANGAWCVAGLLICLIVTSQHFHQHSAWRYWSERNS